MEQKPDNTNQEIVEGTSGLKIRFRSWHPDGEARSCVRLLGDHRTRGMVLIDI